MNETQPVPMDTVSETFYTDLKNKRAVLAEQLKTVREVTPFSVPAATAENNALVGLDYIIGTGIASAVSEEQLYDLTLMRIAILEARAKNYIERKLTPAPLKGSDMGGDIDGSNKQPPPVVGDEPK